MAFRILENIDEKILDTTIEYGSRITTEKPSTKSIAKVCGVSEFVIYDHFSSKENLVAEADKRVMNKLYRVQKKLYCQNIDFKTFWYKMVDYFVTNPTITGWTMNYGYIFPRTKEPTGSKDAENKIMEMGKEALISLGFHLNNDNAYLFTWMWIYRSIVTYAALVIFAGMADFPAAREGSYNLCFNGVSSCLRKEE